MTVSSRRTFRVDTALAAICSAIMLATTPTPEGVCAMGLTDVELVCVDEEATHYGTFQSHNQKVVSNQNGILMTHIRTRNQEYTAQQWRLSRSADGGRTFTTVHEETNATNPPVLETDEAGNLYLARPDFVDGNAYLYRFLAEDGYARPHLSTIPGGSAGKFCMAYDRERRRLYYFAHNNTFHTLDLDGNVLSSRNLLRPGDHAVLQYPLLHLARDGALHAAWTTQKHGIYLYWDIHHMLSSDSGETWETMRGTPLEIPVTADDGGAAERITLDDEFDVHTWLSSFLVKAGKLHFLYLAQTDPARQHYVRYDPATGQRELDLFPEFKGENISLRGLDGFFASDSSAPDSTLYCVMEDGNRIACLASNDNGDTWRDYAVSEPMSNPYSIGGCREVTEDGYVIGSFTDPVEGSDDPDAAKVYFFRIKAGLTAAAR